jgi:hypothetical protein
LSAKEDQYLDLVGSPGWPKEKLRRKLDAIQAEREEISAQLADTTNRLEVGRDFFLTALTLLRDPQAFYRQGGTSLERAMNKFVFTKLFVDGEEISSHALTEPVGDLVEAQHIVFRRTKRPPTPASATPNASSPVRVDEAAWSEPTGADLLGLSLEGQRSSRTALMDVLDHYSNRPPAGTWGGRGSPPQPT